MRSLELRNRRLRPLRRGSKVVLRQGLESRQSLGTGRKPQGLSLGMSRKLLSLLNLSLNLNQGSGLAPRSCHQQQ